MASALILATAGHVFYHHRRSGALVRPSVLLLLLLAAQITLGALTILTARHYVINSLHVVTGASVLVTSLVLALRAHQSRLLALGVATAAPIRMGRMPPERGALEGGPAGPTATGVRA